MSAAQPAPTALPATSPATLARARGRLIDPRGRILQPRLCDGVSATIEIPSADGPWYTACPGCSACQPAVFCAAILRPALQANPFPPLPDDEEF